MYMLTVDHVHNKFRLSKNSHLRRIFRNVLLDKLLSAIISVDGCRIDRVHTLKAKVNFTQEQATKVQRGSRGIPVLVL